MRVSMPVSRAVCCIIDKPGEGGRRKKYGFRGAYIYRIYSAQKL